MMSLFRPSASWAARSPETVTSRSSHEARVPPEGDTVTNPMSEAAVQVRLCAPMLVNLQVAGVNGPWIVR